MRRGLGRMVLGLVVTGVLTLLQCAHAGENFPIKPVRFVVPFPPGGTNDTLARVLAQKLTVTWKQSVIIDNRAGGNGIIGTEIVAQAPADGYTMLMASDTHVINPLLIKTNYDAVASFSPVAVVADSEIALVINKDVPAHTLSEFIELLRSKPGKLNFASPGNGNTLHLVGESFLSKTHTRMTHVPYKGAGPALTDLISGQVQAFFSPTINVVQLVRSGKLRALAVSGSNRLAAWPDVPTFSEAGLKDFDPRAWQGIFVPAATPPAVVDRISEALHTAIDDPALRQELLNRGMTPMFLGPREAAALVKKASSQYQTIIHDANIKLN